MILLRNANACEPMVIIECLNEMANTCVLQDDQRQRQRFLKRALRLAKSSFGAYHPIVALCLYRLAEDVHSNAT